MICRHLRDMAIRDDDERVEDSDRESILDAEDGEFKVIFSAGCHLQL